MTDRLTEIKARLDALGEFNKYVYDENYNSLLVEDEDGAAISVLCYSKMLAPDLTARFRRECDLKLIEDAPTDIAWLIAELEKERAEHDSTLQINRELEEEKDQLKQMLMGYIEIAKKLAIVRRAGNDLIEGMDGLAMRYHESGEMCWCSREACFHQGQSLADCRVANKAIKQWKEVNKT